MIQFNGMTTLRFRRVDAIGDDLGIKAERLL